MMRNLISIEIKGKDNYHEIMNELILSDNYNKEGIDEAFKKKYKATLEKPIYNFSGIDNKHICICSIFALQIR